MRPAFLLVLLLVALLPVAGEAGRIRSSRWPAGEVIVVENRMGREWNQAVEFTVGSWKRAFPRLKYRVVHRHGRPCRPQADRIVVCEIGFRPKVAGLTITRASGHRLLSGLVRVSRTRSGPAWRGAITVYDMQTLCHEFGHALGLNHNGKPKQSCVAPGSTRITPGSFDRQSLRLLYRRDGKGWP